MAEKRGSIEYRDDGTNAQLVTAETVIEGSDIAIPVDIQARYQENFQTHNAVVNPAAAASAFIDASKATQVIFHSNIAGSTLLVEWSIDGTTVVSSESLTGQIFRTQGAAPWVRLKLTATGTATAYAVLTA